MAKQSYNPFKMWGSYLGAIFYILLLLSPYILRYEITENNRWIPLSPIGIFYSPTGDIMMGQIPLIQIGLVLIGNLTIWFMVGYGIHSWIRKARS